MNNAVRISGVLPDGDRNGLVRVASQMVDEPETPHVAVVLLDAVLLTQKVDTHATIPTARILAIEPIPKGADATEMQRLLRRAFEERTGKVELPLELERALDEITLTEETEGRPPGADSPPTGQGGPGGEDDTQ